MLHGLEEVGVSRGGHHVLAVAVDRGAHVGGAVAGLLGGGLQGGGGGEGQVHHVQHAAHALGDLQSNGQMLVSL